MFPPRNDRFYFVLAFCLSLGSAGLLGFILKTQIVGGLNSEEKFFGQLEVARVLMRIGGHVGEGHCPDKSWQEFSGRWPDLALPAGFAMRTFHVTPDDTLSVEIENSSAPGKTYIKWELPITRITGGGCAMDTSRGRMKISPNFLRIDDKCRPPAAQMREATCEPDYFLIYDLRTTRIACCPIPG